LTATGTYVRDTTYANDDTEAKNVQNTAQQELVTKSVMEYLECMHADNETKATDVQNTSQKELVT
jgi:predicted lipid-binding transport protein (Tim44 family)